MGQTLTSFPAARYRFDCIAETPLRLPVYAGSALRGAFGHALKRSVCVTRESNCKSCALYRSCIYPAVFAPPAPEHHAAQKFSEVPAPYVIEPPPWGECHIAPGEGFRFHFILIGHALQHLPILIHAWQRALGAGIGAGDGRARLAAVYHCQPEGDTCIHDATNSTLQQHPAELPPAPPAQTSITLHFSTPLRLQCNGKPLDVGNITAQRLLMGLLKRTALLADLHAGQPLKLDFRDLARHAETITGTHDLRWRDWGRY